MFLNPILNHLCRYILFLCVALCPSFALSSRAILSGGETDKRRYGERGGSNFTKGHKWLVSKWTGLTGAGPRAICGLMGGAGHGEDVRGMGTPDTFPACIRRRGT